MAKEQIPYEIFDLDSLKDLNTEYTKGYRAFRRRRRLVILMRIYGEALDYKNIITKHIIEDVIFDNYLM